jgi:Fur family transcriptional regulator, peroxide stress response regulator
MISNKPGRKTGQKEFVRSYLEGTYVHPTAADIYLAARHRNIKIGLTSIYRILATLEQEGEVITIKSGGKVHYDWVRGGHYHFVCDVCGKITDVTEGVDAFAKIAGANGFNLRSSQGIVIHGICQECSKKQH